MIVDKLYLTKRLPPKNSNQNKNLFESIAEGVDRKSSIKMMSTLQRL
jgi:hypothetical protein